MTLLNKGFQGTVDEVTWAVMSFIGDAEGVQDTSSWAVTPGVGRQVSVAADGGWAFAAGVLSKEDTGPLTKPLFTPTNGQWFLIVRRITTPAKTVTIEAIPGDPTSTAIPSAPPNTLPSINQDPGVLYDQPLAWAWCRSTDTTVVVFDLRKQPVKNRLATIESNLGAIGIWKAFQPTINNFVLGNGSLDCAYARIGDVVVAKYLISFGSTTSITGTLSVTLPGDDSQGSSTDVATMVRGYYNDTSAGEFIELSGIRSNNMTVQVRFPQPVTTGTARMVLTAVTASAPVAPGNGDVIFLTVIYRRA